MIKLHDLPGIAAIENRMTMNDLVGVRLDHELNSMIASVRTTVFGITFDPDLALEIAHDEDADVISTWRKAGWDVIGPGGLILRCLDVFEASMVVVTVGLAEHGLLEIEAEAWAQKQTPIVRPDKTQVERNRRFLQLGKAARASN